MKDLDTKKAMNKVKDMNTKKDFAESHLYKNCLTLFHLCKRKPEMLEEMKKYLRTVNSGIADDLSNITSITLLSLMDDKRIISMKNFDSLVQVFDKINPDLKKELTRICKYFFSCYSIKAYPCGKLL